MAKKKYLLAYMDYATHTGLASVAENLMERLMPFFAENNIEVHIHALNYFGEDKKMNIGGIETLVYSAKKYAKNLNDLWFRDGFLKKLNDFDYDYVWAINDIPVFSPMMGVLKSIQKAKKKKFKSILYCAIDSKPNPVYLNDMGFWDLLVTYTNYGKGELEKYLGEKQEIQVLPHGANRNDFYPLERVDKSALRDKYHLPKNKMIFGNINKNNPRKNIAGTIIAFKYFVDYLKILQEEDKVALYLHCSPTDSSGVNLIKVIQNLELEEYVYFPSKQSYKEGKGYTIEEMNEVYNCLDCFITTTGAEGWGLTITEAMAVELPIIFPSHTSLAEIAEEVNLPYGVYDLFDHIEPIDGENIRRIPNPVSVANVLKRVYNANKRGDKIDLDCYLDALMVYDWDKIAEGWKKLFQNII